MEGVKVRSAPRFKRLCRSAALVSWLGAAAVSAQQSAPAPANPPPASPQESPAQPQTTVTVVAKTRAYKSTIDSKSYSLANTLQADTGSLADVLRGVPSLQVDFDGNVSIRGESDVTILVDGKPSALFSGPQRAQALLSIPAGQYERVEVMTNPPAGVTAEGSGGVINLISKAPPKGGAAPAASGVLKASVGSGDRFNGSVSGVYTAPGLSLTGGASFVRQATTRAVAIRYGFTDPTTDAIVPAYSTAVQGLRGDTLTAYGTAGFDLGPRDHLDASLNTATDRSVQNLPVDYQSGAVTGPFALDYDEPGGFWHGHFSSVDGSVGDTRTLPGDGQTLSIKLSASEFHQITQNGGTFTYETPVQPDLFQDLTLVEDGSQVDLKVDYKTTLPNKAKLSLGYEGKLDWQSQDNRGVQGESTGAAVANPAFAQSFTESQDVEAVYATYQQAFGKLTVQPGLRLEYVTLNTDLVGTAEKGRQDYFEAYPSLHLDYDLGDGAAFKASYGRRAQRPNIFILDPFRTENSPTAFTQGNPDLRPAITQSWELGYEFRQKTTDYQATLFYRDKSDLFTSVTQDLGGEVLLNSFANLGHERDLGLELVANRELIKTLSLSASTDLMRSEIDAQNLGIMVRPSAFIASGQVTLNWQLSPKDYLQLGGQFQGRQLSAQGYRGGSIFSNLGWRHTFDDRLSAVLTSQDPFGISRRTLVTDTPTVTEIEKRKFNYTAVFLGLTYALGAPPKRTGDNFDFGPKGQANP